MQQLLSGLLVVALGLSSARLSGQDARVNKPAVSEPPVTTIKATTRLVQLSIVAQDRKGQPLAGLTKDDFEVFDKGEPQKISLFAQEGGKQPPPAVKTLPVGIYTNRLDMKGDVPGNVTVVLLDALNTRMEDQSYARSQAVKFLEELQPQDHVAIYALTTKLEILHDFTQDIHVLLEAVARYEGRPSGQLKASEGLPADLNPGPPQVAAPVAGAGSASASASSASARIAEALQEMQQLFDNAQQRQQEAAAVNRAEATLSAIEAIARHLAHIPGRKNLVWISGSFPLAISQEGPTKDDPTRSSITFDRQLERVVRVLNQGNLAIYPVDARGLMESVKYSAAEPQNFNPRKDQGYQPERDTRDFISMDLMADRTGGRSFHNNNDLAGVVRTALVDSEMTYQLAFYPSHGKWDGKYHEIKVRVKRPDVQLHYRKGYFATPDPQSDEAQRKAELDGAVESPVEAANLSILVQMSAPAKERPDQFGLSLMLDPREIEFMDTPAGKSCTLDFVFVQRDAEGKQLIGEQRHAEFSPDAKKYESLLQTGMLVTNHVKLLRGVATLKIVVRDAKSGAIGSVTVPLELGPATKS
jgi:VWFA-related protein